MTNPVIPGAEPYSHDGGPDAVLVLHGFTGSPQGLRPIAEALAASGLTVDLPLWPGHGTSVEDLVDKRWDDWSAAAEHAYQQLAAKCGRVALVGLSMGGALACFLAERHPEIAAVVLVNPITEPLADFLAEIANDMVAGGTEVTDGIGSDIAMEGSAEIAYKELPLRASLSLFEGAAAVGSELSKIKCPVLLFSSREDHVLQPSNGDLVVSSVSGPLERVWLERSYHVATLDYDGPEITERTVSFLHGSFELGDS